jgi:hypothetical protein
MDQSLFTMVQTEDGRILLPAHPIHRTAFQDLYHRSRGELHPKSEDTISTTKDRYTSYGGDWNHDQDLRKESQKLWLKQHLRGKPKFAFRPTSFLQEGDPNFRYLGISAADLECMEEKEDGKQVFVYTNKGQSHCDWNNSFSDLKIIVEKQTEQEEK